MSPKEEVTSIPADDMSGVSKRGPALVHDKASHGWDACWLEVTDTAISCYDAEGGKPIRCVAISDEVSE